MSLFISRVTLLSKAVFYDPETYLRPAIVYIITLSRVKILTGKDAKLDVVEPSRALVSLASKYWPRGWMKG